MCSSDLSGHLDWDAAMNEEYRSLLTNDTWDLVPLPKGRKLVRCKWVYKKKFRPYGKVDRHKDHLVAKGFSQVEGIDFPFKGGSKGKKKVDRINFGNKGEGFSIVNAFNL